LRLSAAPAAAFVVPPGSQHFIARRGGHGFLGRGQQLSLDEPGDGGLRRAFRHSDALGNLAVAGLDHISFALFLPTLTAREREVTQLLAEGKSSKEVASLLNLSTKTVETHRSNIMRKLSLHSIRDLVVYAIKNNIIQIDLPLEIKGSPQRSNPQVA